MTSYIKNNKGFTLLEIVIGIAILALIVLPLLGVFASSSRLQGDSFEIGNATLIGENINEQLLGIDFEQWWEEGSVPTLGDGTTGRFVEPDGSGGYTDLSSVPTAPPYYIAFDNMTSSNSVFNAVLSFDPDLVANDALMAQYTAMDYVGMQENLMGRDPDEISWSDFLKEAATLGYDINDTTLFDRNTIPATRTITMNITSSGGAAHASLQYSYAYTYPTAADAAPTDPVYVWDGTTAIIPITPTDGAPIPATGEDNLALFALFYPWYHDGGDNIVINNNAGVPVTVVLSKMISTDDQNALMILEQTYQGGRVTVRPIDSVVLLDNLQHNLYSDLLQHTVVYDGVSSSNSLVQKQEDDRMYSVNVTLFSRTVAGDSDYAAGEAYSLDTTIWK